MSMVRLSARLPRIEAGPLAMARIDARDDDWSEIEALLTTPSPLQVGRATSRGVHRSVVGLAALVATGSLALAGWGALQRTCAGGCGMSRAAMETAAMPTATTDPKSERVASAGRTVGMQEGRSVAPGRPAVPRQSAPPAVVASFIPATDQPAAADEGGAAAPTPWHRTEPHRRHHDSRTRLVDRSSQR